MERKEEVLKICNNLDSETLNLINTLIEQLVFLEKELEHLKSLPFIVVKEDDNKKQRTTPAYKMYKDLSQTYINALKVINGMLGIKGETVESPLREYMRQRLEKKNE